MFFFKTILQPTGFPFLIFKNRFRCLDFVIPPFQDDKNSKANKPEIICFKFDF
jgi:hypothetical protein